MANKFVVWVDDDKIANVLNSASFNSSVDRSSGFRPNTTAISKHVNSGLRQANLVVAAFMNVIAPDSERDLQSSLDEMIDEIANRRPFNTPLRLGHGPFSLEHIYPNSTNNASGEFSVALGSGVVCGPYSFGYGTNVQLLSNNCIGFGRNLFAYGFNAILIGQNLDSGYSDAIVIGNYNADVGNKKIVFGAGTSDAERRNAMTIDENGNVEVLTSPTKSFSVIRQLDLYRFHTYQVFWFCQGTDNGTPYNITIHTIGQTSTSTTASMLIGLINSHLGTTGGQASFTTATKLYPCSGYYGAANVSGVYVNSGDALIVVYNESGYQKTAQIKPEFITANLISVGGTL